MLNFVPTLKGRYTSNEGRSPSFPEYTLSQPWKGDIRIPMGAAHRSTGLQNPDPYKPWKGDILIPMGVSPSGYRDTES